METDILPLSPGKRRYGLYHDNPEHPAKRLLALHLPATTVVPPSASVTQWMGNIRDQGQEGSCTGQMGAAVRDLLYRKLYMFEKNKSIAPAEFQASAAFVYKSNLLADGDLRQDAGSTIHQTFVTLNQRGACLESQEPYTDNDYFTAPTQAQVASALLYKGGAYHTLPTLLEMKACLASGYSLGFGIDVYDSFEADALANTGFMPMPAATEQLLGGHAQHCIGYDDAIAFPDGSKGGLFIQNSWGSEWGASAPGRSDRGCYWMPYAYIDAGHVSDVWMMHLGPAW